MSGPLQYLHAEDPTDAPATGDVPVFGSTGYVPTAGVNGNVTSAGTLTSNQVVIGQGTKAVATLGSLGTTTTVLHGNAAGAPTFATVVEADITLADNTTNNCSTSAHGFLKKLDNNSAHFMDGQGNWSTPAGSGGNVSAAGTLTNHALIIGQGSQDVAALGSLGTTTTLLHGNASGDPTFGAVVEADITLADDTTNDVSTSKHGFFPKLPSGVPGVLLGLTVYNPSSLTDTSVTSTTGADLDATNLTVTFTVPASGQVLIGLTATAFSSTSGVSLIWMLRTTGGSNVAGTKRQVTTSSTTTGLQIPVHHRCLVSSLTPGNSITYRWGVMMSASGTGHVRYGDDTNSTGPEYGPAIMEVWAA